MNLDLERNAAVEAARKAGSFIAWKAGDLAKGDVRHKGRHDLVTVVDEGAEQIIVESLSALFPDDAFLAEEGTGSHHSGSRCWIIDPIDGTTNFAHNLAPFCVSIALEVDRVIEVGVIYEIGRDELFTAVRGAGAFVNGRRMEVSRTSDLDEAIITTGFPFREFSHVDDYITVLRSFMESARAVRRPGSAAADLAWVAAGRMDGFFETGLAAWDVAAGALLVTEAGGRVTDLNGGSNFLHGSQIVASNGRVHDAMLDICSPLQSEP